MKKRGALVLGVAFVALFAGRASAQSACAEGMLRGPRTAGHCCWPGQSWARDHGRCEGPPSCPSGLAEQGDDCVPATVVAPTTTESAATPTSGTEGCPEGYAPLRGSCARVAPSPSSPSTARPILRATPTSRVDSERPAPQSRESHAFSGSTRPLWELLGTALGLWVATYGAGLGIAAAASDDAHRGSAIGYLAIPVAGPWVCLGACHRPEPFAVPLVIDGIVQPILVVLMIIGAVVQVPVHGGSASLPTVMPYASQTSGGLVVHGVF